jgi:ubiquinone/menaquinone biosynthesis C-methylase UbiE
MERELASGRLENATTSMDVVILSQVLHRIADGHRLLSEAYRVLRSDATLLIQSPYEELENQALVKPSLEGERRIYSLAGLHQLLHNAGFKVVETIVYPSGVLGYDWFQLFHCAKQT